MAQANVPNRVVGNVEVCEAAVAGQNSASASAPVCSKVLLARFRERMVSLAFSSWAKMHTAVSL